MGCRFFDLRVANTTADASGVAVLSHRFLSNITLVSALQAINLFLTANPKEILIVDISNDNATPIRYTVGGTVLTAAVDALIASNFNPGFVLTQANAT